MSVCGDWFCIYIYMCVCLELREGTYGLLPVLIN